MHTRSLLVVMATISGLAGALGAAGASRAVAQEAAAVEPAWYIIEDRAAAPDLLVIGLLGEPYIDPLLPAPARAAARRRARRDVPSDFLPRLTLRCENRVTSLTIHRPLRTSGTGSSLGPGGPRQIGGTGGALGPRGGETATADAFEGKLILMFAEDERVEIDLADYPMRTDPILVPEPYDRIGDLRRYESAYFFEVQRGDSVWMGLGSDAWGARVEAVFHLEGLDDLLRARRDPCSWRAS